MGIGTFVDISVSLSAPAPVTRQGFGTLLIATYHTKWADRIRFYTAATALTTLVGEGFATSDPTYKAMAIACAAKPTPKLIAVGRRALPYTQTLTIKLTSAVSGDVYTITIVGSDGVSHTYTLTSTGVPATDATAFAALMTATNIGTVTHASDTVTITQAAGKLTDLQEWSPGLLQVNNTTADPGIVTDLTAIKAANNISWYGVSLDSNSKAEVVAAQGFVDGTGVGGKVGFWDTADYADVDNTSTTDTFSRLQTLGYRKCYLQYCGRQILAYAGVAMGASLLADDPGSYQASYRSLAGVPADSDQTLTETQQLVLNTASTSQPGTGGKNGNWYKSVAGVNVSFPGVTPDGEWIDNIILIDWLQSNMAADIFAVRAGLKKLPYTDGGIGLVAQAIRTRLVIAASPPYQGIQLETIVVTVPKAADVSVIDKNNRDLTGISWSAEVSGGVNTFSGVKGTLTV